MADVQSDASQAPAPEATQAPAPEAAPAAAPATPAPAEALTEVAQAAADTTVQAVAEAGEAVAETGEAVAESAKPVVEAAESVVESAKTMASSVADAVVDTVTAVVDTVTAVVDTATKATSTGPELDSTTIVPPTGGEETGGEGGGEWELLLGKVQAFLGQGKLQSLWAQARNPLTLILAAAALLVVLRVYSALLAAIDSLPLIPGLLELVGVIWAVRFGVPKLVQRSQRQELISGLQQRWESFRGRG
jgi:hypothetical protein